MASIRSHSLFERRHNSFVVSNCLIISIKSLVYEALAEYALVQRFFVRAIWYPLLKSEPISEYSAEKDLRNSLIDNTLKKVLKRKQNIFNKSQLIIFFGLCFFIILLSLLAFRYGLHPVIICHCNFFYSNINLIWETEKAFIFSC